MSQKFSTNQLFKMKKLLFILAIVVATASIANAQDKKWNIGFGAGMASPVGSDFKEFAKVGADYYVNCTYNFTPKMSAGIEYNGAGLVAASATDESGSISATSISSYLVKGVYYFTESSVRPYGAISTGMYSISSGNASTVTFGNSTVTTESKDKTNFGFGAELGLKIKWFNLSVGYQNAGKVDGVSIAYMQYNLGFNIGF